MAALMTAMTGCSGGQTASTQAESGRETQPAGTEAEGGRSGEEAAGTRNRVTDERGWYLWDENGNLTLEGRGAGGKNSSSFHPENIGVKGRP